MVSFHFFQGLEDENSAFYKHGRRLFDLETHEILKFFFTSNFPELSRKLHLNSNNPEAANFFLNTFLETFNYREKNKIRRNDFVSLLLEFKDTFKPKELAAEAFIVYVGGVSLSRYSNRK